MNISNPSMQERHQAALAFIKLILDKKLSGDTIIKISDIMNSQPTPTHAYHKGSALTDILKESKTEAEFLKKMEALKDTDTP